MGFRAQTKGNVPPDGPLAIAGLTIPSGVRLISDYTGEVVGWMVKETPRTHADLQQVVRVLAYYFPQTGLWPVVVYGDTDSDTELTLVGTSSDVGDDFDGEEFLLKAWWFSTLPEWETLTPEISSPFPKAADLYLPASYAGKDPKGLILAPGTSPADALETLGWYCVHDNELMGIGIARIIQSWERRFHLTLVGMGETFMVFQPPVGGLDSHALAALNAEAFRIDPDESDEEDYPPDFVPSIPPHFLPIDDGKSLVTAEI